MKDSILHYRKHFLDHLGRKTWPESPRDLYEPIQYIMDLGGKRIRPALVLLSADLYGAGPEKALPAAMAVETFHNFTLLHDDIMDDAPLRRGKTTVHEQWDTNTAILSGDAMLIEAYRELEAYPPESFKPLMQLFSITALEVCEGQRYDMDFETRQQVTVEEYLKMIRLKTAVLLGCALKMGALVGGAPLGDQEALYEFGIRLGLAFQLQDDYLDVFGDPETFGKQVGGDIIENKKTYLYLRALQLASPEEARELSDLYSIKPADPGQKVDRVRQIFRACGVDRESGEKIREYTEDAFALLQTLQVPDSGKSELRGFGEWLLRREA